MPLPFFLFSDLYFLIPAVITQIFTPIEELVIPIEIKEAKPEMETHPILYLLYFSNCLN